MPTDWKFIHTVDHSERLHRRYENYPERFKNLNGLHVAGKVDASDFLRPSVAIIGTRKPTAYGVRVVRELVPALQPYGWNLLSGGAFGIDTEVHAAALRYGLPTQAWLVGPRARPNPRANWPLFTELTQREGCGLIVPEALEPTGGASPRRDYWLIRNHWLVAAADVVIVIEANIKSGTWSSVHMAAQLGIPVYLIPGSIFSEQSQGLNVMITQGYGLPVSSIGNLIKSLVVDLGGNPYNYYKALGARNRRLGGAPGHHSKVLPQQDIKLLEYIRKKLDQHETLNFQTAWNWAAEGTFTGTRLAEGLMLLVDMGELERAGNRFDRRGSL